MTVISKIIRSFAFDNMNAIIFLLYLEVLIKTCNICRLALICHHQCRFYSKCSPWKHFF